MGKKSSQLIPRQIALRGLPINVRRGRQGTLECGQEMFLISLFSLDEFLKRWVEDPSTFSLLHVYNLGTGEVMKTEQWLDSKVAFEDKKMSFTPFKIPGIVVQNNNEQQNVNTAKSSMAATNLLSIDEETSGPFKKQGQGSGLDKKAAKEKRGPVLVTRTWALCVQMDAWRLMCKCQNLK